jgi:hypothetical protein
MGREPVEGMDPPRLPAASPDAEPIQRQNRTVGSGFGTLRREAHSSASAAEISMATGK